MLDKVFENLITQGSPLAVLVIVVWFMVDKFLKYIQHNADANREMMKEMHSDHMIARKESREALVKVSEALSSHAVAAAKMAESIRDCPLKKQIP